MSDVLAFLQFSARAILSYCQVFLTALVSWCWPRVKVPGGDGRTGRIQERAAVWLVLIATLVPGHAWAEEFERDLKQDAPLHNREEVVEALETLPDRYKRIYFRYQIATIKKIVGVEFIESGAWVVRLEGMFHFYPRGSLVSGRWACLYLDDAHLAPLNMTLFKDFSDEEPDWSECWQ